MYVERFNGSILVFHYGRTNCLEGWIRPFDFFRQKAVDAYNELKSKQAVIVLLDLDKTLWEDVDIKARSPSKPVKESEEDISNAKALLKQGKSFLIESDQIIITLRPGVLDFLQQCYDNEFRVYFVTAADKLYAKRVLRQILNKARATHPRLLQSLLIEEHVISTRDDTVRFYGSIKDFTSAVPYLLYLQDEPEYRHVANLIVAVDDMYQVWNNGRHAHIIPIPPYKSLDDPLFRDPQLHNVGKVLVELRRQIYSIIDSKDIHCIKPLSTSDLLCSAATSVITRSNSFRIQEKNRAIGGGILSHPAKILHHSTGAEAAGHRDTAQRVSQLHDTFKFFFGTKANY